MRGGRGRGWCQVNKRRGTVARWHGRRRRRRQGGPAALAGSGGGAAPRATADPAVAANTKAIRIQDMAPDIDTLAAACSVKEPAD